MWRVGPSSFLSACDALKVTVLYSVIQLILPRLFSKTVEIAFFCFEALKYSAQKSIKVKYFAGSWVTQGTSGVERKSAFHFSSL